MPSEKASPDKTMEHTHEHANEKSAPKKVTYTCPMHPEISSPKPGSCPKCGMKLVPKTPDADGERK
jgi:hypothetical protein